MSRYLRCHECKTTTWIGAALAEDPTNMVYCSRCNRSRMLMFWIDLTDQPWVKEEQEKHGNRDS